MRPATQKESLPNDIESLIRRLGQELSCSICLSVFENPTMTPCNHTFCKECIERAVSLTKKSSTVPLNQCPICKSKVPKRSLNPSPAVSRLCTIYEEIVRSYSELNGGNEDWIHEAGIRGNDGYYTGGGIALDNLTQLYPYPEKPSVSSLSPVSKPKITDQTEQNISETDENNITQLQFSQEKYETSRVYDETTQLEGYRSINLNFSAVDDLIPSSPLIYNEQEHEQEHEHGNEHKQKPDRKNQAASNDHLIVNTQALEKLAEINESIDRELAEFEMKLAETKIESFFDATKYKVDKENSTENNENSNSKFSDLTKRNKLNEVKVKVYSSKCENIGLKKRSKTNVKSNVVTKKDVIEHDHWSDITAITTTAIKDENSLLQLTDWSDRFNIQIHSNLNSAGVTHLIIPTDSDLIVKKRTIKYFDALLLGATKIQIISFKWIEACLINSDFKGKVLNPEVFRIKGDEIKISRCTSISGDLSKLFSSVKFYLYGHFSQPPRNQLEKLIQSSHSIMIKSTKELTRGTIVLADPGSQFSFEQDAEIIRKYPIVGPSWFMDSISCGMLLDFREYLIL